MRTAATLLTLGFLLGASAPALAAATPGEARRLTSLFQSYLGQTPGVVSVAPQDDSYAVKLDLGPLFAKVMDPAITLSLSPLEWTLTDLGGGKWKVHQNQPLDYSFSVKGESEAKGSLASLVSTSIFDEALGGLATSSAEFKGYTEHQTITAPGATTRFTTFLEAASMQTVMQGSPDAADATSTYSFTGLKYTISVPAAADGSTPGMDFVVAIPSGEQDSTMKGLKLKAARDVITWLLARRDSREIVAGQAELKDRLRAALPLFASLSGANTWDDITVSSPIGTFAVKQVRIATEMSGIVASGSLRQTSGFTGLEMPSGLLPPWAAGLVPKNLSLDMSVSDFDLAAPAALILDKLDLSKPEPLPKDFEQPLVKALVPKGSVTVTLGPSEILAKLYDVTAEGNLTAGPAATPSGDALVTMKGLDEVMTALRAGPSDIQQMSAALLLVKGLGKAQDDGTLSWKIETTPAGAIAVNGVGVSKMMGGGQQQ